MAEESGKVHTGTYVINKFFVQTKTCAVVLQFADDEVERAEVRLFNLVTGRHTTYLHLGDLGPAPNRALMRLIHLHLALGKLLEEVDRVMPDLEIEDAMGVELDDWERHQQGEVEDEV